MRCGPARGGTPDPLQLQQTGFATLVAGLLGGEAIGLITCLGFWLLGAGSRSASPSSCFRFSLEW